MALKTPIEIYTDASGLCRWRLRATNGQIVAGGQQGYKSRRGALKGLAAVGKAFGLRSEKVAKLIKDDGRGGS